ncbi:hypothetical protein CEXT_367451 [Caerostris extrusa]|uniref:Uncharacterized protein n=1 Tax=Caerostris extrusa TaxID=172846 RepID=A0AAV4TUG4_CAEEX|nr:hypothetical protein CEXT_367451 [Caerostris extrusa]
MAVTLNKRPRVQLVLRNRYASCQLPDSEEEGCVFRRSCPRRYWKCYADEAVLRCRKIHLVPGDSTRVAVPPEASLSGQIKPPITTKNNLTASDMGAVTADLECMDIAQDTSTGTPTTIFPEITETVVDISIEAPFTISNTKRFSWPPMIS